jgi:hypothetical protein
MHLIETHEEIDFMKSCTYFPIASTIRQVLFGSIIEREREREEERGRERGGEREREGEGEGGRERKSLFDNLR